jgi:surface antigen
MISLQALLLIVVALISMLAFAASREPVEEATPTHNFSLTQVLNVTAGDSNYTYNNSPTTGTVLIERTNPKDKSGESSIYQGFPTTFLAGNFTDPEGDSITYEWKVDGDIQTAEDSKLAYTFASAGSHTVEVRARDSLGAFSDWASKTMDTVMYSSYAGSSYGWCTYYAALEFDKYGLDGVQAVFPGKNWSAVDAVSWFANAKAVGWATSTDGNAPVEGAIIVWHGGTAGHVGIVFSFNSTHMRIGEMNWPIGSGINTYRYLSLSNLDRGSYSFVGYIYPYQVDDIPELHIGTIVVATLMILALAVYRTKRRDERPDTHVTSPNACSRTIREQPNLLGKYMFIQMLGYTYSDAE